MIEGFIFASKTNAKGLEHYISEAAGHQVNTYLHDIQINGSQAKRMPIYLFSTQPANWLINIQEEMNKNDKIQIPHNHIPHIKEYVGEDITNRIQEIVKKQPRMALLYDVYPEANQIRPAAKIRAVNHITQQHYESGELQVQDSEQFLDVITGNSIIDIKNTFR